jgi:hypothetical protein
LSKKKREETPDYEEPDEVEEPTVKKGKWKAKRVETPEEPDEVEEASAKTGKLKARRVESPEHEQAEESEVKNGKNKAVQSDDEEPVVRYGRIATRLAPNKKVKIEPEVLEDEFDKTGNLKPG